MVCSISVSRFCYVSSFCQQNNLICCFRRFSVPPACLRYWSLWNFIAFVTPRHTVHKHRTGFYLASIDLLWFFHLGSLAIKAPSAHCLWLSLSNFTLVGFGSDVLWGCYCIHRRHPVSFVLPNRALFWKGIDLFHFGSFPYDFDLRRLTFFGLIFSINILIYIALRKTYFFIPSALNFTALLSSSII